MPQELVPDIREKYSVLLFYKSPFDLKVLGSCSVFTRFPNFLKHHFGKFRNSVSHNNTSYGSTLDVEAFVFLLLPI